MTQPNEVGSDPGTIEHDQLRVVLLRYGDITAVLSRGRILDVVDEQPLAPLRVHDFLALGQRRRACDGKLLAYASSGHEHSLLSHLQQERIDRHCGAARREQGT